MEKITKYFTFDYINDTTIEYVNTGLYSSLTCSYTSEDPNYGTDTLHYNADPAVSMEQMAYEFSSDLTNYLDNDISPETKMMFQDYSNSTLYAIEKALIEISKGFNPYKWFDTLQKSCLEIARRIVNDGKKSFSFCESNDEERRKYSPEEYEKIGEGWFGIKRIDSIFDNGEDEYIVATGYYGGGNVKTAYVYGDSWNGDAEIMDLAEQIMKNIMSLTDFKPETIIYVTEEKEEN